MNKDDPRRAVLESLRGQSLTIPDLGALLSKWPHYVNPEIDRLRTYVDDQLDGLFAEGERLDKMRLADAALFAASWWPYAPYEALKVATSLSIWLFAWDDESDSTEFASLVLDYEQANLFRAETTAFARSCLQMDPYLGNSSQSATASSKSPENAIIASFEPIGKAISKSCTSAQTQAFFDEMLYFVDMTDQEQKVQINKQFPSVEEYRKRRMGSSAVGMCLAITEYCLGMELPVEVMRDRHMQVVWTETNVIISTTNDILSIGKEIKQEQVDTLIPLLFVQYGTLEAAMNEALKILKASIAAFEFSSQRVLERHLGDTELHRKLLSFFHGCRCACTANLQWSLGSGRYQLGTHSLRGGVIVTL